jgi:hypothetical protein
MPRNQVIIRVSRRPLVADTFPACPLGAFVVTCLGLVGALVGWAVVFAAWLYFKLTVAFAAASLVGERVAVEVLDSASVVAGFVNCTVVEDRPWVPGMDFGMVDFWMSIVVVEVRSGVAWVETEGAVVDDREVVVGKIEVVDWMELTAGVVPLVPSTDTKTK